MEVAEKVFNSKMMFVLQKLRENSLYVRPGEVFEYHYEQEGKPGARKSIRVKPVAIVPREEYRMLKRLEGDGAIKAIVWGDIPNPEREPNILEIPMLSPGVTHPKFALIQPRFDELVAQCRQELDPSPRQTAEAVGLVVPQFRFYKGMLHRDGCDPVVAFAEDTQEFTLLRVAMEHPAGERIDAVTDGIGMNLRSLYDAARRINKKIKDAFGIDGFFRTEWSDRYIERVVE